MDPSKPSHLKGKRSSLRGKPLALEKETYLISLAIKDDALVLGSIQGKAFIPNERGRVLAACWQNLAQIRPDLHGDAIQISPRHLQGLLIIVSTEDESNSLSQAVRLIKAYTNLQLSRLSPKHAASWKNGYSERLVSGTRELAVARQALKNRVFE